MEKDQILSILAKYSKLATLMVDSGLLIRADAEEHQVDDEQIRELSKVFREDIKINLVDFEGEKIPEAYLNIEGYRFHCWKYSEG